MELGVTAEEMRGLVATITNSIGAAMRAARRLLFLDAIEAFSAGTGGGPCHPIFNAQRLAGPIRLESRAELNDAANGLVPEDDRQRDRQFTFPEVDIGAAYSRHLSADECRPRLQCGRQWIFVCDQGRVEAFQNRSPGSFHLITPR